MEWLALVLFVLVLAALMTGFPVAMTLSGASLIFAAIAVQLGAFDMAFLNSIPNRIYSIMGNEALIAVPLFVFMGIMLEKSKIAEQLLTTMNEAMRGLKGGLGISVILVGALLAASTGIVGATVVTMGLLALPTMLKQGYDPKIATGTICASGTLGQIIPPSIVLILLGDVLSNAYQQAQLNQGIFSPETLSVGDLFVGAIIPGILLVVLYMAYILITAIRQPERLPSQEAHYQPGIGGRILKSLLPPLLLILLVLGSILGGYATPTESASLGALGAMVLAAVKGRLSLSNLNAVMRETLIVTSMIFFIFIGAAFFSLVFRGLGGDELIESFLTDLPGGQLTAMLIVMLLIFVLGFFLDFIEITYVILPVVAPILLMGGMDPIWLGIMIAINLQTAFLTPPFGFALFYLRGVAPKSVKTIDLYRGVVPFILIQIFVITLLWFWPELATWLPHQVYS